MADALLTASLVLAAAFVAVYMVWDLSVTTGRLVRQARLDGERAARAAEDAAWAAFRAETAARADDLASVLHDHAAVDRLVQLIDEYAPATRDDWPVVA